MVRSEYWIRLRRSQSPVSTFPALLVIVGVDES